MGQSQPFKPIAIVVEDDFFQSSFAGTVLEEAGFEVIERASGEAALQTIRGKAGRVLFVFTDIGLGSGMDGLELAAIVRRECPHVTVVVTSGNIGERRNHLAAKTLFVPKPWLPLDLLMAAESAKEQHS